MVQPKTTGWMCDECHCKMLEGAVGWATAPDVARGQKVTCCPDHQPPGFRDRSDVMRSRRTVRVYTVAASSRPAR